MAGQLGLSMKNRLVQLFNIKNDPTEKNEVSDQYPRIVNVMLSKIADYHVRLI